MDDGNKNIQTNNAPCASDSLPAEKADKEQAQELTPPPELPAEEGTQTIPPPEPAEQEQEDAPPMDDEAELIDVPEDDDAEKPPEPKLIEREKFLLCADDVVELLGVKKCTAYKIIRECNEELKAANKLVLHGKVLRKYLLKKIEV